MLGGQPQPAQLGDAPARIAVAPLAPDDALAHVEGAPVLDEGAGGKVGLVAGDQDAHLRPVGRHGELGDRRGLRQRVEDPGDEGRRRGVRRGALGQRAAGADVAVGDGHQRLDLALAGEIDSLAHEQPARVGGARGRQLGGRRARDWARLAQLELRLQQRPEALRAAAQVDHRLGGTARLGADRDEDCALGVLGDHLVVAALDPADGAKLVAGDEHVVDRDALLAAQLAAHPGDGVGLVGQADLYVLDVAGHPRVLEPDLAADVLGEPQHLVEPAGQPRAAQAREHRVEQVADGPLRRVGPLGQRDDVDLAAVEPVVDHVGLQPAVGEDVAHPVGRGGQQALLLLARLALPLEDRLRAAVEAEDLGAAVGGDVEPAVVLPVDDPGELVGGVGQVGAGDHHDEHAVGEQPVEQLVDRARVLLAAHHRGAVPVEGDDLEGPREPDVFLGADTCQASHLHPPTALAA